HLRSPLSPYTTLFRSQDHDLLVVGDNGLVLLLVGGVEVRHIAVELGGTGVDHLIDGDNTGGFALLADVQLRGVPQLGDILVGEADRKSTRLNSSHVSI